MYLFNYVCVCDAFLTVGMQALHKNTKTIQIQQNIIETNKTSISSAAPGALQVLGCEPWAKGYYTCRKRRTTSAAQTAVSTVPPARPLTSCCPLPLMWFMLTEGFKRGGSSRADSLFKRKTDLWSDRWCKYL